ncbi:MAG: DUF3524 domain-containing protein [Chloroflexi bacterium]|nr:DUF3524 domain-containing protein [Chloroflexota bacterium]
MRIALLESYYGGSHKAWADSYKTFSTLDIELITLPPQFWKWRMQGAAITFARLLQSKPDLILASGMIDLSIFRALTYRHLGDVPTALYFHENQLSYPQNRRQAHGWRYGFINYVSALTADSNYFNSPFHLRDFMDQLPRLLKHFADYNELDTIERIRAKSQVLPLGIDLRRFDQFELPSQRAGPPLIVWNHRWEEDKNPDAFVHSLLQLASEDIDFRVAITGESFGQMPAAFQRLQAQLPNRIEQLGYLDSFADYAQLLWRADYVVSTAWQEFFGVSICEAIYCNCVPILPDRLNYPDLLTEELRGKCLYTRDRLTAQMRRHLRGDLHVDLVPLRAKIAEFDWHVMAPRYDEKLHALAMSHHARLNRHH